MGKTDKINLRIVPFKHFKRRLSSTVVIRSMASLFTDVGMFVHDLGVSLQRGLALTLFATLLAHRRYLFGNVLPLAPRAIPLLVQILRAQLISLDLFLVEDLRLPPSVLPRRTAFDVVSLPHVNFQCFRREEQLGTARTHD